MKNKDIVITKPDKGNGVVILDQKLYNLLLKKKFQTLLNSKSSMKSQPSTYWQSFTTYQNKTFKNLQRVL